jgi:hypothetical protein
MNDLELATVREREQPWWYVRPPLLASLIALALICLLVWVMTRAYLPRLNPFSYLAEGAALFTRLSDYTVSFIVNS